jgi:deoxyribodipyrimidine photo-lyase
MRRILWWLRRDLRVHDNLVLFQALQHADAVIPVFVLDARLWNSAKLAPARKQFLWESLAALDANLKERGAYLVLRQGDPAREIVNLARETQADAVYFHKDYTPYARRRDERVVAALDAAGIRAASFNELYLADPAQVVKDDGTPYTVYSRYRARFEQVVAVPPRYCLNQNLNTPPDIFSLPLQTMVLARDARFAPGGETAAAQLAREFVTRPNGLAAYAAVREDLAADATSHLSPHLHFGTVSVRELVRLARDTFPATHRARAETSAARTALENARVWLDEIVWREFFNHVLYHFPHAARTSFRAEFSDLAWRNNPEFFQAWCEGRTGYPIVDAGMRQLKQIGWMHNRARMITASFLTKDLLVDWRAGEIFFLQNLIDGDMASNNGGWQWAAGTGTDAQPYFRIFNPMRQGARFDPTGTYVRRYVPELANVPDEFIHAPWAMPADVARQVGFALGRDYPKPIVVHATQREQALALYRQKGKRSTMQQLEPERNQILETNI